MALSLSFGSSGSTPQQGYLGGPTTPISPFLSTSSVSPYTKALSSVQAPNMSTVNGPRYAPPPVIPPPSTPVKKTTVNNVDGSSHTTEYHAPTAAPTAAPTDPAGGGGHAVIPTAPTTSGLLPPQSSAPATTSTQMSAPAPTAGTTTTPTISGLIGGATNAAQSNEALAARAQAIADQYAPKFQALEPQIASEAGDLSTGTSSVGEGNAAIAAQVASAETNNLQNAQNAAMAGITPGLTAANQEAGALNTTAGLIPSPLLYGTFGGSGSNLDPQTAIQNAVSTLSSGSGSIGYTSLYNQLSSAYGPTIANQLLPALQKANPSFNVAQSDAQATTAGAQETQVQGFKSALQQGQNLQSQLKDLITTFGLNPNDVNAANIGLQKIALNTSDPHYQQLSNYVNDIANTYAQILTPPGGSATDTTRAIASSMLDATAKGTSILDTMKSLDNAAQAKIAGVPTLGGSTGSGTGSAPTTYAEVW